jgi:hypothetical protein
MKIAIDSILNDTVLAIDGSRIFEKGIFISFDEFMLIPSAL